MGKNRYQVQGPFRRRNKPQYWLVMDTVKKFVIAQHARRGDAARQAMELEHRVDQEMRRLNEQSR
jgi:hypothetical protein